MIRLYGLHPISRIIIPARDLQMKTRAGVSPQKLSLTDPLAGIMGAAKALAFDLGLMGPGTIQGAGAGRFETGEAVLQDLLTIHRDRA